jgi:hypothetical protein
LQLREYLHCKQCTVTCSSLDVARGKWKQKNTYVRACVCVKMEAENKRMVRNKYANVKG